MSKTQSSSVCSLALESTMAYWDIQLKKQHFCCPLCFYENSLNLFVDCVVFFLISIPMKSVSFAQEMELLFCILLYSRVTNLGYFLLPVQYTLWKQHWSWAVLHVCITITVHAAQPVFFSTISHVRIQEVHYNQTCCEKNVHQLYSCCCNANIKQKRGIDSCISFAAAVCLIPCLGFLIWQSRWLV